MICDQCETVAHCTKHGCVPKQPAPTEDKALKLALEALEWMVANDDTNEGDEPVERLGGQSWNEYNAYWLDGLNNSRAAITAIKQALAAPVQEGWKLVPVVATREIEDAIGKARNLKASEIWEDALAATPPAAQPAPVKVWEAEGYDSLMQEMQMVKARNIRQHAEIERLKAAQPAVPDAIGPNEDELPAYAAGWNDCRQAMLEMMK
jgi:hypothetical protein